MRRTENYSNRKKNGSKKKRFFFYKSSSCFFVRLNISGSGSRLEESTTTSRSSTGRKRARYDSVERPTTTNQFLDGINIIEDESSQPKFVKLFNNSNQNVALNGWLLKRKVGSQSYEFKFPKGMVLRAGATTTVNTSFFSIEIAFRMFVLFRSGVRM